jgi:hypothetical protein
MLYMMKAYQTEYRGRIYRSRLEAKWAAFFDLAGWEHEYEPIDFGGWTPDFMLQSPKRKSPMFVEVKPITAFDVTTSHKMASSLRGGGDAFLLLVGVSPLLPVGDPPSHAGSWQWEQSGAEIGWSTLVCGHDSPSWYPTYIAPTSTNRMLDLFDVEGPPDGWFSGESNAPDDSPPWGWQRHIASLREKWAQATNEVQWRPE